MHEETVWTHTNGATTKVTSYPSPDDNALVVEVDTDGEHPTTVRLWVNDAKVYDEVVAP